MMLLQTIPSQSIPRRLVVLSRNPRNHGLNKSIESRGAAVWSMTQLCRSSCSGRSALSLSSKSWSSLLPDSRRVGTCTIISLVASLARSALCATTTSASCDDKNDWSNHNNNGDDDEDIISKIRSKLDSLPLPDLRNNDALDAVLTSLGVHISAAISSGVPTDLSYGFFAGYFSGLALKKIGKAASVTLGISFLALQTLAYHGYIEVHHDKLQKQVEELLDRNNDGVVDGEDIKSALDEVRRVAGFGLEDKNLLASGGGFGMGFWGGLRSG